MENAIEREQELPKFIISLVRVLRGEPLEDETSNKKMRSSEEILKDYGLEVG